MLRPILLGFACGAVAAGAVTFHKDVAPVLQRRCQNCHRAGEIGPMPLLTYRDARPWAKAIAEAAQNAVDLEQKGELELARTWRHIEDAMKLMRGPHQS